MEAAKGSIKSVNSSGDNGHSCQVPLCDGSDFDMTTFFVTGIVGVLIHLVKVNLKSRETVIAYDLSKGLNGVAPR